MQMGLNCRSLANDLPVEDIVVAASLAGFSGVEIRMREVCDFAERTSWAAAYDLFAERGLNPIAFIDGIHPGLIGPEDKYKQSTQKWGALCQAAARVGCHIATIVVNPRTDNPRGYALGIAKSRLRELASSAARHSVTVAIEVLGIKRGISPRLDGRNYFMDRFHQAVELTSGADMANVGVVLDAFHWHVGGGTLDEIRESPKGRIVLFHINDAPPGAPAELMDADRVLPGSGVIDLSSLLTAARHSGFDGFVSVELFNEELWAMAPSAAAKQSFQSVKEVLAGWQLAT
jgi:sugar phosphate isomerase/epimerase